MQIALISGRWTVKKVDTHDGIVIRICSVSNANDSRSWQAIRELFGGAICRGAETGSVGRPNLSVRALRKILAKKLHLREREYVAGPATLDE